MSTSRPPDNAQQTGAARAPELHLDESRLIAAYANFCRVTGTPEELIVDFGLNAAAMEAGSAPIGMSQRIVMNYFTAKRLLQALGMSVQRYEQTFGVLETNVSRRVQQSATPKPAE